MTTLCNAPEIVIPQELSKSYPQDTVIKVNEYAVIWRYGYWIFKKTNPKFASTELWALQAMCNSGYVPRAWRIDEDTLAIWDLGDQKKSWRSITNADEFLSHTARVLDALQKASVRHGDLTKSAIIIVNNRPMLIDFAESRHADDLRPDKRSEGDRYWLTRTMKALAAR